MKHVFGYRILVIDSLKCPRPQTEEGAGGQELFPVPRFLSSEWGDEEGALMSDEGVVRPVALTALGQRYRRYRLADPPAEEAMAASLRRWGQLSPVVACRRGAELELLDGFKRWTAARQVAGLTTLSVRVLELDDDPARACACVPAPGRRGP